ncbi:MAG: tRNA (adenosine(37)-N6)-threonylcarbamoyltransferase complex transferase subunit TsaD [Chlamydiales bacterium]|nr:tRNA (adenosine(37)-N6)-threonylcarbamoyltransferase complex transferase subunit TsaD [Chlamydiales bacterium]
MVLVLGIESTCDETAAAVVEDSVHILSNEIATQEDLHALYGGVIPELACRRHIDTLIPIIQKALTQAKCTLQDIDLISVAKGPGLIGALLLGVSAAKSLSLALNIPFIGVNHVEAHLYAAYMTRISEVLFPALGLVISGGHTFLIQIQEIGKYTLIGQTVDDAIGEAFDKVAAMLRLPYPGGPVVELLAKTGNENAYSFKAGSVKGKPFDFSFSGLKTNVLYAIKGQGAKKDSPLIIQESDKKNIAASFQKSALTDIVSKSLLAAKTFNCKCLLVGGGVSNNNYLKMLFTKENRDNIPLFFPEKALSLDNAAMIAGLGYHLYSKGKPADSLDLEALTRIPI